MMNDDLLKQLYAIHAPTGHEWPLICFIRNYLSQHIPEAHVQMDGWGNLYITKPPQTPHNTPKGFPTLVCHLDQVQTLHSDDFCVKEGLFTHNEHEERGYYGWSEAHQRREGLGADDKNGIYIALICLQQCPCLKVFMAVGEEKGCIGSNRARMDFFADSLYVLEPDCIGGKEIHTELRGIPCASHDFEQALLNTHSSFIAHHSSLVIPHSSFTITPGKTSDILALTLNNIGVSCANIPAGYHQPHNDNEYTLYNELAHTLAFVKHFVTTQHQRFPHTYKTYTQLMIEKG